VLRDLNWPLEPLIDVPEELRTACAFHVNLVAEMITPSLRGGNS
jgi:hypothetical protein